MNSPEYEIAKTEALSKIKETLFLMNGLKAEEAIKHWISFSKLKFFDFSHSFDQKLVYLLTNENKINLFELYLYEDEYIQKAWREKDKEGLGGEKSFLIAGIEGSDELMFLTEDFSQGFSILHHEDVFLSYDLDNDVKESIKDQKCTLYELFEGLIEGR